LHVDHQDFNTLSAALLQLLESFDAGLDNLATDGTPRYSVCFRQLTGYLNVTQPDLQREFYRARQNTAQSYRPPSLPPPLTYPESVRPSRPHATFWRCTDASSPMTKPAAAYSVSIHGSWTLLNNSRTSQRKKNEERLAGQSASVRKSETVKQ
jgi:hypothetical protein